MTNENLTGQIDPDDVREIDTSDKEKDNKSDDSDEGYDILPSNGPGLTGDDAEQVLDGGTEEEMEADEDEEKEDV